MVHQTTGPVEAAQGVLIVCPWFRPNIGGVETHLQDLVLGLDRLGYRVYVHTYSPTTTPGVSWARREKMGTQIYIRRYRWFGKTIFHWIERYPVFDFLYLSPYLFIRIFWWMLWHASSVDAIHAHGFNATLIGVVLKKLFHKKLVVTTHAVYEYVTPELGKKIAHILKSADKIIAINQKAMGQLIEWGVPEAKMILFRQFIDSTIFFPRDKMRIRQDLHFGGHTFNVLFVGRLLEKKGVKVLLEVAKQLPTIQFIFIGVGPEAQVVEAHASEYPNIRYLGRVSDEDLPRYYALGDVFCLPSQYPEGFPRVIAEALASGLPIVGSCLGGTSEVLDDRVAILVEPTIANLQEAISTLATNRPLFEQKAAQCVPFAQTHFSEKNLADITQYYSSDYMGDGSHTKSSVKLNLGCGPSGLDDWINFDYGILPLLSKFPRCRELLIRLKILPETYRRHWAPITLVDLRKRFPLAEATVDYIYSSQVLEHFERYETLHILRECYRCLRSGGVLRVSVPEIETMFTLYHRLKQEGKRAGLELCRVWWGAEHDVPPRTRIQKWSRYFIRDHKWHYDTDELALLLREAGFPNMTVCAYRQGRVPDIDRLDLEEHRPHSIYVEAVKP